MPKPANLAPLLLAVLLGGVAAPVAAEDEAQASARRSASPREDATGSAVAERIVERLLEDAARPPSEPRALGLAEAVRAAVENNPGIRAEAEIPRRDAFGAYGATAAFDPALRTTATGSHTKVPSGSALASGLTTFREQAVRSEVSISKLMRTGASMDLAWQSQIIDTNSIFLRINPRYDNRLTLSLRQPLLRDFGAIDERTTVLVARSEAEESLAAFEARLSEFVGEVIDAYWGYVQAAAELEVSRRSVALAEELVRDAEAKVAVGLLAPVAVKEARADAAARKEQALVADNALVVAGRTLEHAVMLEADAGGAPLPVVPGEDHVVAPVELDRAASLRAAVEHRAEVRGATIALDRRRLEEKRTRNLRLPDLDFVAHYGLAGLAGDARPVVDENGNVQYSPYDGDYGDSLSDLLSNDYADAAVGLELRVPLGNAEAEARYAEAEIEVRRASRTLEQTISQVALDVDRALADVASAFERVAASKAARELAEENLRNQTRRFELGAVTTKDVLDFQEKLAAALATEVRAIADHARALGRLRSAEGTLLERFDLRVEAPGAPGEPWWARF